MRKINIVYIMLFAVVSCTKVDMESISPQAASANKGVPVFSEVWMNGVLQQKNYYEDGRLVKVSLPTGPFPREYQYSYRDKDHYVVMTGDYGYYHYYFNDDHQLILAVASDYDDSPNGRWVKHEFTWEKDRIKTHNWYVGNLPVGTFIGSEEIYQYKNPWEATIMEYSVEYTNGVKTMDKLEAVHHYQWKTPFEFRFMTGENSYTANIYSTTVKTPSFNSGGFPWGYYSFEDLNKHDLMNLLAKSWGAGISMGNWKSSPLSGMLQIKDLEVVDGTVTVTSEVKNIVVNKDKLPVSFDAYNYTNNTVTHYEYKYIRL